LRKLGNQKALIVASEWGIEFRSPGGHLGDRPIDRFERQALPPPKKKNNVQKIVLYKKHFEHVLE